MKYILKNEAQTCAFAQHLAQKLKFGSVIALSGDLGAGKSVFSRALMRALNVPDKALPSPTYAIIQEYHGQLESGQACRVAHMDWYRLDDGEEVEMLGVREFFIAPWISIVEWPERSMSSFPSDMMHITLSYVAGFDDQRCLELADETIFDTIVNHE
ncbi:MAG: tRNA (adenosine(37)-N6)-threonylcarbamoyltransferase complex ATPase subunit type 1 TsaE [Mariprofundaceae bacterium]